MSKNPTTKNHLSKNRERWLKEATEILRPIFKVAGMEIPKNTFISCGFPSSRGLHGTIGEAWTNKENFHVFINPILGVLEGGP